VLGQFKRGKSTFLNALLGEAMLPTSVVPLTSIPTFLYPGDSLYARVSFKNGQPKTEFATGQNREMASFIAQYVTEKENPNNLLGVAQVEVFYPSPLLQKGVILIDTPGIGSTFRHNTEATLNFLPQCDAAVFLISADPPITEVEVDFLKTIRSKVSRLFFILNKTDYLSETEKQEALTFFKKVLRERIGLSEDQPVFSVSARWGLEAKQSRDSTLWKKSGLDIVEKHLIYFLVSEKEKALQEAVLRKTKDVISDVRMRIHLAIRSLQMPLSDLEERLNIFSWELEKAQTQRVAAKDLLAGDRKRLLEFLEEQAAILFQKARNYLAGIAQESQRTMKDKIEESVIQEAVAQAVPTFFERELGEMSREIDQRIKGILQPHQQRAEELIQTIKQAASEVFEIPYFKPNASDLFEMQRQPYWITHQWSSNLTPIPTGWLEQLLPHRMQRSRMEKRMLERIESLVGSNVENLRWATWQNLEKTFLRFAAGLDERLQETITATRGAIQTVYSKRKEKTQIVAEEIKRLENVGQKLKEIQERYF